MLSCSNLTKRFDELTAVDSIAFRVPAGTICALLGPNGAGKSTIVKMLTGLLKPTSGAAEVAGVEVAGDPLRLKQSIGVLPENLALFDALTVEEHLQLTGAVYGLDDRETKSRADQLLRALALEHGRHTFADQCSHGMRKKTALAMALLPNPAVLFLDEPFEGIDPVTAKSIRDLLVAIAARGITVFLTSHILSIVEKLASQILMIRQGRIVFDSSAQAIDRPLEELYFELVEPPRVEELAWLGPRRS